MRVTDWKTVALATIGTLSLSGCASAPANQGPYALRHSNSDMALAHTAALDQTNHMVKHLDEHKRAIYFQNFGGGGAAVGLLLGPLGVAANVKAIDSATTKDVEALRGRIASNPVLAFKSAASRAGVVVHEQPNGTAARATPYLYVVKMQDEPEALSIAAALIVESPSDKPAKRKNAPAQPQWRYKYMYQLPGKYTLASLAALDSAAQRKLDMDLDSGYAELLKIVSSDTAENAAKEKPVKFKSTFLVPRFDFEQMGNLIAEESEMVWLRNPTGVYGIQRDSYQSLDRQARR